MKIRPWIGRRLGIFKATVTTDNVALYVNKKININFVLQTDVLVRILMPSIMKDMKKSKFCRGEGLFEKNDDKEKANV